MILLLDIGNTNITIGIADLAKINRVYRLNSRLDKTADEYYYAIKTMVDCHVKAIVICSVVPELTRILSEMAIKHFDVEPLIIGLKTKTGVMIKADNPREVGADLVADAAGLVREYGPTGLIIDLGTATKYIYVQDGKIAGVIICPGVFISMKALVDSTALLPDIDVRVPEKVLGNNTINCMQSGVTYGTACQVDGFIERIKEEIGTNELSVYATGGLAKQIVPLCKSKVIEDDNLTLKGILNIYLKNI